MLEQKNQPTYIVNFYGNIDQKSILYRKKILSASVCKNNCAMSAENISRVGFTTTDVGCCIFYSIFE